MLKLDLIQIMNQIDKCLNETKNKKYNCIDER